MTHGKEHNANLGADEENDSRCRGRGQCWVPVKAKKAEGKCKPEFLDKRIQLADKKLYFVQCFNSKQLEKLCHIFIITYSAP